MNYCTHAIEGMKWIKKYMTECGQPNDAAISQVYIQALQDSVKFLLPLDADVGCTVQTATALSFVRLPYPVVAFEYATKDDEDTTPTELGRTLSSKRVALAMTSDYYYKTVKEAFAHSTDNRPNPFTEDHIILIKVAHEDATGRWMPGLIGVALNVKTAYNVDVPGGFEIHTVPHFVSIMKNMAEHQGIPYSDFTRVNKLEQGSEVQTVMNALACLNAKNINQIAVPPPEKLNAKRIRNGKAPFFTYHVLDIFLGDNVRKLASGTGERLRGSLHQLLSATVRLHAVRGHFKQRRTGLFWWKHFVRGQSAAGVVDKDYNLIAANRSEQ